jgi:hypothetical protein
MIKMSLVRGEASTGYCSRGDVLMSIQNRIILTLQSALRADSLEPGIKIDTPYVISSFDGRLIDCNSIFCELVARDDLQGTHYRERCPTDEIEECTNQLLESIETLGFSKSRLPLLAYDGKVHDVSYEHQLIGISGRAFVLSSGIVERFDIGKISRQTDRKIFSLKNKPYTQH